MVEQKLKLPRDQLATFLKNHEQIKQFERLFAVADAVAPASDTMGISIEAGTASASATEALALIAALDAVMQTLPPSGATDAIKDLVSLAEAAYIAAMNALAKVESIQAQEWYDRTPAEVSAQESYLPPDVLTQPDIAIQTPIDIASLYDGFRIILESLAFAPIRNNIALSHDVNGTLPFANQTPVVRSNQVLTWLSM